MANIEKKTKQNPKLQQSELKDGRASLYLEFYLGRSESPVLDDDGNQVLYTSGAMKGKPKYKVKHIRKKENLNLYIWLHPRSTQERLQNKNTLILAKQIRFEREQEFLEEREGYRLKKERNRDFLSYFVEQYQNPTLTKSTYKGLLHTYVKFVDFLSKSPRYKLYSKSLRMEQITSELLQEFIQYLTQICKGQGAKNKFEYIKRVVMSAVDEGLIKKNPCKGLVIKCDKSIVTKEILTLEEIQQLMSTHYEGEQPEVQKAFVFSLFTGVRWCDVSRLTYADVDEKGGFLRFKQKKVEKHSNRSWVSIPLNDDILTLIGKPKSDNRETERIFDIGVYSCCMKHLKRWVKAAGITKNISWHCSRHSFAVNLLTNGANIKTVADLMGHSSITMTEKYLHTIDAHKKTAINSLGPINFVPNQ